MGDIHAPCGERRLGNVQRVLSLWRLAPILQVYVLIFMAAGAKHVGCEELAINFRAWVLSLHVKTIGHPVLHSDYVTGLLCHPVNPDDCYCECSRVRRKPSTARFRHRSGLISERAVPLCDSVGKSTIQYEHCRSHAALRLLEKGHGVTIVDNLSRGNFGAIKELMMSVARPGQLHFVEADFGDKAKMLEVCKGTRFDCVMHFAALAYVPESMAEPHLYYRNNAASTLTLLEVMREAGLKRLIFSSTWATLGEPEKMPVTEETPALPTNPYGASKKMAEDMIKDTARLSKDGFGCAILRYFNVVGSDPEGRIGEAPASEASKKYARITGACFAAATGKRDGMDIMGTDWPTPDGTCVRDYIHVTDLVNAHIAVMPFLEDNKVRLYNVGTGKGERLWLTRDEHRFGLACPCLGSFASASNRSVNRHCC
eukprot:jgi/Mesvir1/13458/Mv16517-RA.1